MLMSRIGGAAARAGNYMFVVHLTGASESRNLMQNQILVTRQVYHHPSKRARLCECGYNVAESIHKEAR
jgi:hypothetical protein